MVLGDDPNIVSRPVIQIVRYGLDEYYGLRIDAEDMELELSEIFPKQSEIKIQAVRLLLHLQESGPKIQTQLAEKLDLEDYVISRLLAKLETHRYVTRRKDGADKIVDLSS